VWRNFFKTSWSECKLNEPAVEAQLQLCEEELSLALPTSLRTFLLASDGLLGPDGSAYVLPAAQIVRTNVDLWLNQDNDEKFMPLECLLFFGRGQNNDLYAYPIRGEAAHEVRIFRWQRDNDSRVFFAEGLEQYFYMRWKSLQEADSAFWDHTRSCKDFEDFRTFLRWIREAELAV
jgi:hypothetical protein